METYYALVRNSRFKMDTNERWWKPLGYVTLGLFGVVLTLTCLTLALAKAASKQQAEVTRLRTATVTRMLRGGYVVTENGSGKYLAIPTAILDGRPFPCVSAAKPYLCLRVKSL